MDLHLHRVHFLVVNSDDGQSDIQAVHIRSSLESCVEPRNYGVEKKSVPVAHPDPGMADVGLQGGNPVADHVSRISELVHDRIVEQRTGIVDPEIPVDCSRLWVLVTWNADNPGVGPGS